ncbi:valine--tRNA ligase, partial [Candidatus Woesearchaeota archaeon]
YTLHYVLDKILRLLAPVIPMITHKLYSELYDKEIHEQTFPETEKEEKTEFTTEDITTLNSTIWKTKKDSGKSLKEELKTLILDKKFEKAEKDLKATHNTKEIKYGEFKVEV